MRRCGRRRREQSRASHEEKRRGAVDQPTAHSARKQLEQEVACPLQTRERAYQREHKAAVDACVLLAETGGKVEEQKTRVEQASVEAALEKARMREPTIGCGQAFVAFARSNPQGAAAMLLTARHPQPGPGILPGQSRPAARSHPGAAGPRDTACASTATGGSTTQHSSVFLPSHGSQFPRRSREPGWMPGRRVLVLVVLFIRFSGHHPAAQPVGDTAVSEGSEWPAVQGLLCVQLSQQQPQQQLCMQSVLDIPNAQFAPTQHKSASPGTARFLVSSPACCHAWVADQCGS